MRKIHNFSDQICYFGIVRDGGKLLVLYNHIYGDDIYVNPRKIILSNVNHQNSKTTVHPKTSKYLNRLKLG